MVIITSLILAVLLVCSICVNYSLYMKYREESDRYDCQLRRYSDALKSINNVNRVYKAIPMTTFSNKNVWCVAGYTKDNNFTVFVKRFDDPDGEYNCRQAEELAEILNKF